MFMLKTFLTFPHPDSILCLDLRYLFYIVVRCIFDLHRATECTVAAGMNKVLTVFGKALNCYF